MFFLNLEPRTSNYLDEYDCKEATSSFRTVATTCSYCGCGCNFSLEVLDDKLVGTILCKTFPVNQGILCIKGWNGHEFVQSRKRLTKPFVRKQGELTEVSWVEALDYTAFRLKEIRDNNGKDSIGFLTSAKVTNEENYIMQKFARASEITRVSKEDIEKIAEYFALAETSSIVYCMGITQHTTGVDNVKSLANLAMLTGNVGREASGVNPLRGQNNVQGGCDMGGLPNVFTGYQPVNNRENQPTAIVLYLDAMVMDNDDAQKREEVYPTYKKCKGFNGLQITWEGYLANTILRPGHIHSNSGRSVEKMVPRMVKTIREQYRNDVPIIFRIDSGFMDQKLYKVFEELGVGFISSGKLYKDLTNLMASIPEKKWHRFFGSGNIEDKRIWEYFEFGDPRKSWDMFRRAIFTRPMTEDGQFVLPFVRPCTVIYSNLGMGYTVDFQLKEAGLKWLLSADGIIDCFHDQGRGELTFRAFKDFGSEELPFHKYKYNVVFYHCMVMAYNLYQAFKEDICSEVVPVSSYLTTLRRKVIDIGCKIVKTSHQIILKVSKAVFDVLDFNKLCRRCCNSPQIEV